MIERIWAKPEMHSAIAEARHEGKTIGLVPSMGALHEGHLSLVHAACARTDFVVVSIFVNPTQFAPGEDFELYPRDIAADLDLLGADGVAVVFTPSVEGMYGASAQASVEPGPLASRWEGEIRPGHFGGAATVVAKLFNIVHPDLAFFGEKDYQQLRIVQQMNRDLDLGVGVRLSDRTRPRRFGPLEPQRVLVRRRPGSGTRAARGARGRSAGACVGRA